MNENLWFSFETIIAFSNIYMIMFLKVDWEKLNNYLAKKKLVSDKCPNLRKKNLLLFVTVLRYGC